MAKNIFNLHIDQDGKTLECRVSDEVVLGLTSEFGPVYDSSNDNMFGKGLTLLSGGKYTTVNSQGSTQIWKGSSSGSFSFEIALITKDDPVKDVRDKMILLYKMISPSKSGLLISAPKEVTLTIPDVLVLENYYITNVQFAQSMKLMRTNPDAKIALPMRATGVIEVIPSLMILKDDVSKIFPNGTA